VMLFKAKFAVWRAHLDMMISPGRWRCESHCASYVCTGAETFEPPHEILVRLLWGARWPSDMIRSTAKRTARLLVPGFELADHSLGLVVEGGDGFMTVPRSRPG
jgi:hypothetical protein